MAVKKVVKAKRTNKAPKRDEKAFATCGVCKTEFQVEPEIMAMGDGDGGEYDASQMCKCPCGIIVCLEHSIVSGLKGISEFNPRDHTPADHTAQVTPTVRFLQNLVEQLRTSLREANEEVSNVRVAWREPEVASNMQTDLWPHGLDPLAYVAFAQDVVRLRIEAGDHPDDAMLDGKMLMDAWAYVQIDGAYPKRT